MPTIRENLLALIKFIEDEPLNLFNLSYYHHETNCGTLHCSLGLAATKPYFHEQGLHYTEDFHPMIAIQGHHWTACIDELFGSEAYMRLFKARECGSYDQTLKPGITLNGEAFEDAGYTDKDLALDRLKLQLSFYPE